MMVSALASPITYEQKSPNNRKGRDLVIVLDSSGSMGESGYSAEKSDERKFDVVISVLNDFISKRYDDNMGIVVFGTFAFASAPLTYDTNALKYVLRFLDVGIAGDNTAIGEGIEQAIRVLDNGSAEKKVIILLSDGFANSGSISAKDAVKQAIDKGIKIYTIGLGESKEYDEKLLKLIAKDSKGKFFKAQNASSLQEVYSELNSLEPSPIRSEHYLHKRVLFHIPLFIAIALLIFLSLKRLGLRR
jgi:Ca-activated chloride channel family protein